MTGPSAIRQAYGIARDIERLEAVLAHLAAARDEWIRVAVAEGVLSDETDLGTIAYDPATKEFSAQANTRTLPWHGVVDQ